MLNRQKKSGVNRRHDDGQTGDVLLKPVKTGSRTGQYVEIQNVLLVRCEEPGGGACPETVCRLVCDKDAIAFAAGDVLVNTGLCAGCAERGVEPLPACIGQCTAAPRKTLHTASTDEKRRRAAEAFV
jgi:hypothetical protein